jgi:competence protein ComEA
VTEKIREVTRYQEYWHNRLSKVTASAWRLCIIWLARQPVVAYGGAMDRVAEIVSQGARFAAFSLILGFCSGVSLAQQTGQPPAHPQYSELPEGAGKDTLIRVCGKCHSPDNVIANGQDRAGWEGTISKMAGFGAVASDDEFTEILDYLVKNFPGSGGPVHVNQATSGQLVSGLGLTSTEADAVIAYRKKNGDFKTLDDLKKVPDVDAKKLDAKKDQLVF